MKIPNVLIIADREDATFLDMDSQCENWNLFWEVIDYNKLHAHIDELKLLAVEYNIDFVLYSRNDQIANGIRIGPITKKLKKGYSSFSGIDTRNRKDQMVECFRDFVECGQELKVDHIKKDTEKIYDNINGTFSLIFDTEQLGGVKFGLPRILALLNQHNIVATFFVTNIVKKVYPNVLELIQGYGHEVGLHGLWHEYLAGLNFNDQKYQLEVMTNDLNINIKGVNFLGRMDGETINALIDNKVEYFVYPNINYYRMLGYPKLSTLPSLINKSSGEIWALPISVETYNLPWFSIKNMIDVAICQSKKSQFKHITILCHPFRDGNLQHIQITEKLLTYLINMGFKSLPLKEVPSLADYNKNDFMLIDNFNRMTTPKKIWFSFPTTAQDLISMVPQNLIVIYQLLMKNRTLF